MKNVRVKSGSMILTCIFFISMLMLVLLMQWRSQEALQIIMRVRISQVKKLYAADALLQYGMQFCKENYEPLSEALADRTTPLLLAFNQWPMGEGARVQGTLEISSSHKNGFKITAYLKGQDKKLICVSCNLEKRLDNDKNVYVVSAWKRCEL